MCVGNNDRCSLRTTTTESPLRNIKAFNCVSPILLMVSLAEFSYDVNERSKRSTFPLQKWINCATLK